MLTNRTTRDVWSGLFWLFAGLLICYGASRLGLGSVSDPGAGFIFFWSGFILALLSVALVAGALRTVATPVPEMEGTNWAKVSLVLASLLLYAAVLEKLGFVLTTFALLSFLLGTSGGKSWPRVIGVASAAAAGSFALFELWLKIRLPKGIFGF
ncbi:MAG: tripartite tricarboxylate transporter TctB family protein [Candidatus Omnitrophota bacterium]